MRSELINGPVENKILMEVSPLENIAKVIDFYFPFLIRNLLNMAEDTLGKSEEGREASVIGFFWDCVKKENVFDAMFFYDYYLYLNFFLQYPVVMCERLEENMKCADIVEKYRQAYIKNEMQGSVLGTDKEEEYTLIISEENDVAGEYQEDASEVGDVLQEILQIDETISRYYQNSKLYQADAISNEKGCVTLELVDGTRKQGLSWGVGGVYTGKGYEIKNMLTFVDMDENGHTFLEEEDIKAIIN